MFGSLNPVLELPVTVVSAQLIIQGTIHTRLKRLTDVVNEPDIDHLVLFDTTFLEVGSRRVIAGPATSQVQLPDVLFLHSGGPTQSGTEMRTPKQPVKAVVLAPPFTIEGLVHLPYEQELHQALDALSGQFIAMTSARYWAYGVAESPIYVDLLVLNRYRAHVAIPAGVQWRSEAQQDPGQGRASNPW